MSHRLERIAERIQQDLAQLILTEVKDERLMAVSITGVRVSPDLLTAHVHYVVLGEQDERARRQVARSLERASGFLRSALAQRIQLRRMPKLEFHFDASLERGLEMESLLGELRERGEMGDEDDAPLEAHEDDVESGALDLDDTDRDELSPDDDGGEDDLV